MLSASRSVARFGWFDSLFSWYRRHLETSHFWFDYFWEFLTFGRLLPVQNDDRQSESESCPGELIGLLFYTTFVASWEKRSHPFV